MVTVTDPGSPLRGSVTLSGTATDADAGSGVASMRFEYRPSGASTWTDCLAPSTPYSCALATAALTDGLYDLRAVATDAAGNSTTSDVVANRRVDNTAPAVTVSDPGALLRGTVTLTATAGDAGSGITSVRLQRSLTGSSAWSDVCSAISSPTSCSLNTTTLTDGGDDLRAIAAPDEQALFLARAGRGSRRGRRTPRSARSASALPLSSPLTCCDTRA